jgi:hypothetical protein
MDTMSPLIHLDELQSRPSLSDSPSGYPKTTSNPRSLTLSLIPDEEAYDPYHDTSSSRNFQTPIRPQLFGQRPIMRPRQILLKGTWQLTKTFLIPFITIAYLSFCYVVQYRVVPFSQGLYDKLDDTWLGMNPSLLSPSPTLISSKAIVKSGVTTISIIIVSISLYPVYDLLSSLKASHFLTSFT